MTLTVCEWLAFFPATWPYEGRLTVFCLRRALSLTLMGILFAGSCQHSVSWPNVPSFFYTRTLASQQVFSMRKDVDDALGPSCLLSIMCKEGLTEFWTHTKSAFAFVGASQASNDTSRVLIVLVAADAPTLLSFIHWHHEFQIPRRRSKSC